MVWIILSPNDHSTLPWISEKSTLYPCQVQNYQLHLTQILLSILTTPIRHYGIEIFPYEDHGEEDEEKTRSWRQNKKLKRRQEMKGRQEDQDKRDQVKEMKVLDLMT
jgi:hypothetical protein